MLSTNRLFLYARTLRHLRASQVIHFVRRRLLPCSPSTHLTNNLTLRSGVGIGAYPINRGATGSDGHFGFLNRAKTFEAGPGGWASKDMPKLWRYNLHYFDYLQHAQRSVESKSHLVSDWIKQNPPGTGDAWEPYPVSLRIVNWIKYFLERSSKCGDTLPVEWLKSLRQQALWLERNIEYHILANHYLKNGVALYFAGAYFEGPDADRWLKRGVKILREELDEQILEDGGHYERSPMYHSICVLDYLDVLNLARHSQEVLPPDDQATFAQKMTRSLDFLNDMCLPDNEIALFNDSAFRITPSPQDIIAYGKNVIGYEPPVRPSGLTTYAHAASGYFVCRNDEDVIIIDCGCIGPDYQPGHAHCDMLSFELALDGRRVFVDSGVHDYEPSEERAYARSTKAHNTVVVDGEDQSEIWGVFRVARRARPLEARIEQRPDGSVLFTGAHDGYRRLPGRPIHRRTITYDAKERWLVEDRLEGDGRHLMESYLHVHPDCRVIQDGRRYKLWDCRINETVAIVEALIADEVKVKEDWYFPEFGLRQSKCVIVFSCTGNMPLRLGYQLRKIVRPTHN